MKTPALPVAYEIRLFRGCYRTADQPGIFRPAIVNAVSRNQEEEGHDRGIDDSDETIRVRFRGLDNTNTVFEMQL